MPAVNVKEAKTQLSRPLRWVEAGEEVVIARRGRAALQAPSSTADRRTGASDTPTAGRHTLPSAISNYSTVTG